MPGASLFAFIQVCLLVLCCMPRAAQANGSDNTCFAKAAYAGICPASIQTTIIDPVEQAELAAAGVGAVVYFGNSNGCWRFGVVAQEGQMFNIDSTTVDPDLTCDKFIDTEVTFCFGGCGTLKKRHLEESTPEDTVVSLQPGDKNYQHYIRHCGDVQYKGSLVIQHAHFYAVATPATSTTDCPSFATSALFHDQEEEVSSTENTKMGASPPYYKELKAVKDVDSYFLGRLQDSDYSLPIGTYALSELVAAHERVDPSQSKKSSGHSSYDIVKLNCADFVLSLASELNIKVDAAMTSFVARRLVQDAGKHLAHQVRNSLHFSSLFGPTTKGNNLLRSSSSSSSSSSSTQQQDEPASDTQVLQALLQHRLLQYGVTNKEIDAAASVLAAAEEESAPAAAHGEGGQVFLASLSKGLVQA